MSGMYLYCQNTDCGAYLGSLGGDGCQHCGWTNPEPQADTRDAELLEALTKAATHIEAMMAHIENKPERFKQHCWQQALDARAAIAKATGAASSAAVQGGAA